jgi:hypothetical protein
MRFIDRSGLNLKGNFYTEVTESTEDTEKRGEIL